MLLCRLLDDNRQLYVPELQETINPHPHFMLLATQNPPGQPPYLQALAAMQLTGYTHWNNVLPLSSQDICISQVMPVAPAVYHVLRLSSQYLACCSCILANIVLCL